MDIPDLASVVSLKKSPITDWNIYTYSTGGKNIVVRYDCKVNSGDPASAGSLEKWPITDWCICTYSTGGKDIVLRYDCKKDADDPASAR